MTTMKRNMKEKDALLKQGQEELEKLKQELKEKDTEIKKLINKPKKTMAALEIQIQKLEEQHDIDAAVIKSYKQQEKTAPNVQLSGKLQLNHKSEKAIPSGTYKNMIEEGHNQ